MPQVENRPTLFDTLAEASAEPAHAKHEELDASLAEPVSSEPQELRPQDLERLDSEQPDQIEPSHLIIRAQKVTFEDSPTALPLEPVKRKNVWGWIAASCLLLLVVLAQAAYFFRVELAASQPGLKPALISYCSLLQCSVPMPKKAELMSIETSELEADPAQASVIALNALLRNHAPYTQAYPDLELTLTDTQDKPLARRTFHPAEYLKSDADEKDGLASNRELSVKLNLDTTDIKPSGYRLFLFYP